MLLLLKLNFPSLSVGFPHVIQVFKCPKTIEAELRWLRQVRVVKKKLQSEEILHREIRQKSLLDLTPGEVTSYVSARPDFREHNGCIVPKRIIKQFLFPNPGNPIASSHKKKKKNLLCHANPRIHFRWLFCEKRFKLCCWKREVETLMLWETRGWVLIKSLLSTLCTRLGNYCHKRRFTSYFSSSLLERAVLESLPHTELLEATCATMHRTHCEPAQSLKDLRVL